MRDQSMNAEALYNPMTVILLDDNVSPPAHSRLVSLVGKVAVYRAGGLGSIVGRTNSQGLKIIEEKLLPLLLHVQMVRLCVFSDKDVKQWATGDLSVFLCVSLSCEKCPVKMVSPISRPLVS